MRKLLLQLLAAILAASASPAVARADALESGLWDSPWGKLKFEREEGQLVGKLADAGKACGLSKGDPVLRGEVDEELFTGEARVCFPTSCSDPEWALALALSTKGTARWLGGVLEPGRGCPSSPKGAFKLERPKPTATAVRNHAQIDRFKSRDAEALVNDARIARMEDPRGALRMLKAAEQKEPDHPYILELMSDIYRQQKEYDQAKSYLHRLSKKDPSGGFYNLACMEAQYGSREQAVKYLDKSIAAGWSNVDAAEEDPDLAPIRGMPVWDRMRAAMQRNDRKGKKP